MSFNHSALMNRIKCVAIGDADLAETKAALLVTYTTGVYPGDDYQGVFENCTNNVIIDGKNVDLLLWDTSGEEEYKTIRTITYAGTDIFVAVFSLINKSSLEHIERKWIPEVREISNNAKFILCGTSFTQYKKLNDNNIALNKSLKSIKPVSQCDIKRIRRLKGVVGYFEVSCFDKIHILELFQYAIRAVLYDYRRENIYGKSLEDLIEVDNKLYFITKDDEAIVIDVFDNKIVNIPSIINVKLKKYPVTEINLEKQSDVIAIELHFEKSSSIQFIKNSFLQTLQHLDIPPLLVLIDKNTAKSVINLKTINIINPKKSKFELNNKVFLINKEISELVLTLNTDKSHEPKLIDVKKVNPYAFSGNTIDYDVFEKNSKLIEISEFCFYKSKISSITIPNTCRIIAQCCFKDCSNLSKINISTNCQLFIIKDEAFSNTKIKEIYLPKDLLVILKNCFDQCKNLSKIEFSDESSCEKFEYDCFGTCTRDIVIKVPPSFNSLINIPKELLFNLDLSANEEIIIDDDYIYEKKGASLFYVRPNDQSKIILNEQITEVSENAYDDCPCIEEVETMSKKVILSHFPKSVKIIRLAKKTEKFFGAECYFNLKTIISNTDDIVMFSNSESLPQDLIIVAMNPDLVSFKRAADIHKVISQQEYIRRKSMSDLYNRRNYQEFKLNNHKCASSCYNFSSFGENETVSMSEAVIDFDKFENPRFLGRGGCGTVYAMTNTDDGKEYAVKTLNNINDESSKSFVREVEILCEVAHPCTMKIIGYSFYQSEESPARIALEFCRFGTVSDIMKQIYKGDRESISLFDGTRRSMIVVGVSYGMRYLHDLEIIHRDLKPQNIFLDDQLLPKIGDFGISKFSDCDSTLTKNIGTLFYSAPETFDHFYDNKCDVYSFGLILYELSSLSPAYPHSMTEAQLMKKKLIGEHPTPPPGASEVVRHMINSCLSLEPRDRPSFDEIIKQMKSSNFELFDGTDVSSVSIYSKAIELFEENY